MSTGRRETGMACFGGGAWRWQAALDRWIQPGSLELLIIDIAGRAARLEAVLVDEERSNIWKDQYPAVDSRGPNQAGVPRLHKRGECGRALTWSGFSISVRLHIAEQPSAHEDAEDQVLPQRPDNRKSE